MEIIHHILDPDYKFENATAVTIGNFDGVHSGHISILKKLLSISKHNNSVPVVITFDPHPLSVVNSSGAPGQLTDIREKLKLLENHGMPVIALIHFDKRFSQYSADWFINEVLVKKMNAKHVVIGVNHAFGRNREGDVEYLKEALPARGVLLDIVKPIKKSGVMVSSSNIRAELMDGKFDNAVKMLGHPYPLFGRVVSGKGVGKMLGYPTINMEVGERKILPPDGVYACMVERSQDTVGGMLYVGTRPTFDGKTRVIEISCFCPLNVETGDFIEVYALSYFRADIKFESTELLRKQLRKDEKKIGSYLRRNKIKLTLG